MLLLLRARQGVMVFGAILGFAVASGCSGSAFESDDEGDAGQGGMGGSSGGTTGGSATNGGSGGSSGVSGGGGEGDAGSSGVCDELVCENAGECVITANGAARCDCAVGFSGERCETNIDDCMPNPCENDGICRDLLDAFRCECPPGFTGETCGDAGDVCEPNPCQNGAMCLATEDGHHCDCAEGFSGDDCGTNIDDCAPDPCENGTCHDGIDAFVCECDEGYAGDRCEFRINGCDPNPCRNGGVCSASGTDVTCDCTPGFTGTLCEQTRYVDVLAGETHSCALAGDGVVTCWGNNMWGQTDAPVDLLDSISDGAVLNSCGMAGETAICWGWNSTLPGDASYRSISGGAWDANCYVTSDGAIGCWGGNADILDSVPGDKDYAEVSLGFYFGCGLTTGGGVRCWGSDAYGQITNTPRAAGFDAMDVGYWRACGIRDGALSCWGLPPGELPTGTFSSLSVGIEHGCAVRTDGTVGCWESPPHDDGRAVPPDGEFLVVSAGGGHTCGVTIENSVVCWGNNEFGQSDATPGF